MPKNNPKLARGVFAIPQRFLTEPVRVTLVGCGGTGSEVLDGLARLHCALLALGHPYGLQVVAVDGDTVSAANVGRQRFGSSDVGHNKAVVLIHRVNLFYGFRWQAVPRYLSPREIAHCTRFDLLLTCVDKASVRLAIGRELGRSWMDALWMDFGNGATRGQVVLGHLKERVTAESLRLPNVVDLFPELDRVDDSAAPSCSLAEALHAQDLFVNRTIANAGLQILWQLFKDGTIRHHGAFVDVQTLSCRPLAIDPVTWSFLGYAPTVKRPRKATRQRAA